MTHDLQIQDYTDGYRFRVKCLHCGYGWYRDPEELLCLKGVHRRMYLDEVGRLVRCPDCRKSGVSILPMLILPQHHFVGGLP